MHRAVANAPGLFGALGIAQCHGVHAVDGNLMLRDEVTLDRFSHTLRTLNSGRPRRGRVRRNLQNVTLAARNAGGQAIQLLASVRAQYWALAAEVYID